MTFAFLKRIFTPTVWREVPAPHGSFRYYKYREFAANDFSAVFWKGAREILQIEYSDKRKHLFLDAELVGDRWDTISVLIPQFDAHDEKLLSDLKQSIVAVGFGYVVSRRNPDQVLAEETAPKKR